MSRAMDTAPEFFLRNYSALRTPHQPMKWMKRMFNEIIGGSYPRLVDLPTGAGKTELVTIWLIALAWHGKNGKAGSPVPRRLIWVVNRRVLVQQVFTIAEELVGRLTTSNSPELTEMRAGLGAVSGGEELFHIVQLRGQIVADRDWAIRPASPQLVIGTVDQIGSRLLFQGYGLGKWGRPQQAGFLGVDSWVAVDEAHLVPACVLTLRQLHPRCATSTEIPTPLRSLFNRLPFWLTELSATPGLPKPSDNEPFQLKGDESEDKEIADRVLASTTRRVRIVPLTVPAGKKAEEILVAELASAAFACDSKERPMCVAIFVRKVKTANEVAKQLKKAGVSEGHLCKITGRIRGYERDRITKRDVFRRFLPVRPGDSPNPIDATVFLIGTAAAEVGLDADADVIFCDFAALPTLLQRLGRLDRRGIKSRKFADSGGEPPEMRIFTVPPKEFKKEGQLIGLAKALAGDKQPCSPEMLTGAYWCRARSKAPETEANGEGQANAETAPSPEAAKETKGGIDSDGLVEAATWSVLDVKSGVCSKPDSWLKHRFARIAAGPVALPPLTAPTLDHWCATTEDRSPYLSPHPFLYGFESGDEGTPLVGLAFRLEVEALRDAHLKEDQDDPDAPGIAAAVLEIFEKFPPQRAELHQIPLTIVREWLATAAATEQPILYRSRDRWFLKTNGEGGSSIREEVTPGTTIVLSASASSKELLKTLLTDSEGHETAVCDVLDGVSQAARYRRSVKAAASGQARLLCPTTGAFVWQVSKVEDDEAKNYIPMNADEPGSWGQFLRKDLPVYDGVYEFRYFKLKRAHGDLQYLDSYEGKPGHLARAESDAAEIASAIAPGDEFLQTLLCAAARSHDEGKRHRKWQRAFGRTEGEPELAKLHPSLERNAPLKGFRHEWESLRSLHQDGEVVPRALSAEDNELWRDLLRHLIGVHHGNLRPSLRDEGLNPDIATGRQNPLRIEAAERFTRLQQTIGPWRLAYLEALLKTADALASQEEEHDED